MKKTSIALIIGLFAVGCEKAPQKASTPPMAPDAASMAAHLAHAGPPRTEEKKEEATEEKKPEGAAAEPAPVEEKKE